MARHEIAMPQLGESVTEGTVSRWLKGIGEHVDEDELLFEVSTDKVDSEVPSPAAGTLVEIRVPEGETITVGTTLCVVSDDASEVAPEVAAVPEPAADAATQPTVAAAPPPAAPGTGPAPAVPGGNGQGGPVLSPVVRRLISENGIDAAQLRGTGEGGRITRNDVLAHIERTRPTGVAPPRQPAAAPAVAPLTATPGGRDEVSPFSNIRRRTAEHMVRSRATSPHAFMAFEIDYEKVERVRRGQRQSWLTDEGFGLTYLPFIARAVCDAIREFPHVNASVDGENLVVHHAVNMGIAVDIAFQGLVVPVIKDADSKRLRQLAREIGDLAARARSKRLSPDDLMGGTFTLTNAGPWGTLFTGAIINQPQVAILSTDGIAKRPVVVEGPAGDAIAIHHVGVLCQTWDHRAFDGAYCAAFLKRVKEIIESRDWATELT